MAYVFTRLKQHLQYIICIIFQENRLVKLFFSETSVGTYLGDTGGGKGMEIPFGHRAATMEGMYPCGLCH